LLDGFGYGSFKPRLLPLPRNEQRHHQSKSEAQAEARQDRAHRVTLNKLVNPAAFFPTNLVH
jgi:hypothetical protein